MATTNRRATHQIVIDQPIAFDFLYNDETFLKSKHTQTAASKLTELTEVKEYIKTPIEFAEDDSSESDSCSSLNETESSSQYYDSTSTLNETEPDDDDDGDSLHCNTPYIGDDEFEFDHECTDEYNAYDEYDLQCEGDEDEDDSLSSNEDDVLQLVDEELAALMEMHNECSTPLFEADEFNNDNLQLIIHRPAPSIGMQYTPKDFMERDHDEEKHNANGPRYRYKIWQKLRKIPRSLERDTTETRIVREFTLFTYHHDAEPSIKHENIILHNMEYPNIFKWNGLFIGPQCTPYYNGKYKICIIFRKNYPKTPPTVFVVTKIYNSSVKWNKKKERGLVCLPKYFEKIWNEYIPIRRWINAVYEFIFHYGGDHYYDPINRKMANQFKYAFDSFVDYCYKYNVLYGNGYNKALGMIQKQKLTSYCIQYGNQFEIEQYNELKEDIWIILREKYHIKYEIFMQLMYYFGDEFYYCCLSQFIRHPHVCIAHKVKQFSNIIQW